MYKIEKFRSDKNKQYYFRIVAENGKIVSSSEGYKNRGDRDEIADGFANKMNSLGWFKIKQYGCNVQFTTRMCDTYESKEKLLSFCKIIKTEDIDDVRFNHLKEYTLKSDFVTSTDEFLVCMLDNGMPLFFVDVDNNGGPYLSKPLMLVCMAYGITCIDKNLYNALQLYDDLVLSDAMQIASLYRKYRK